ncbi:MAG: hypothetical protein ACQGVK_09925 [Myxococcota bacterium]
MPTKTKKETESNAARESFEALIKISTAPDMPGHLISGDEKPSTVCAFWMNARYRRDGRHRKTGLKHKLLMVVHESATDEDIAGLAGRMIADLFGVVRDHSKDPTWNELMRQAGVKEGDRLLEPEA